MTIKEILGSALYKIQQEYGLVITDVKVDWSSFGCLGGEDVHHINNIKFEGEVHQPHNTSKEMGL